MKALKTPLRYPGGKSRAAKYLIGQFPIDIKEYREPFIGGGSVAIEFTKQNPDIPVWVNDKYKPLYAFWLALRDDAEYLSNKLTQLKQKHPDPDSAKKLFLDAKERVAEDDIAYKDKAAYFYVLNKCSFSGLGENSSFSPQASNSNFSQRGIDKLTGYGEIIKDWKITNLDYTTLLKDTEDAFVFMDPPYDIKSFLYGEKGGTMHRNFTHDVFALDCSTSGKKWMITYNSSKSIKKLFENYNLTEWDLTYTMRSTGSYNLDQSKRKELLITNYTNKSPLEDLFNEQLQTI